MARFVTRVPPNVSPFTFSLVNIHTDPDEVETELPVMATVLKGIREFEYMSAREDDVTPSLFKETRKGIEDRE